MSKDVVLRLFFTVNEMDCISMLALTKTQWTQMKKYLKRYKNHNVFQVYMSIPPMEFYGDNFTGEELLSRIHDFTGQEFVKAFETMFGDSFYTNVDVLGDLLEKINE